MLKMNDSLSVLFINWNLMLSKGGLNICKAIEKNGKLQVFDISFNNIGSKTDMKLAETLKSLFLSNSTLIHIDISHWKLTSQELRIINEGLTHNHSILGIHMVGNKGKIDTLGKKWTYFYRIYWCWSRWRHCNYSYCYKTYIRIKYWKN